MGVGEKHALAYINHKKVILKAICDFDQQKLNDLNIKFCNVEKYNNDQSILNDKDIDVVSIASYDNYHYNQIVNAINNSKHVMAEKPLCLNHNEMLEIFEAQKQNPKVKLSSNLVLRANSRFMKFKNDINKGDFGDVFYIEGDYYWGRREKLFSWRAEMDYYSIILGAAIHMIDIVMWLLNSKPINIHAIWNNIQNRETNLKYNSFAVILMKFENGVIAKITGNGGCVHPHYHGLKIFGTERTTIHNLTGAYYLDPSKPNSDQIPITEPYPEKKTREKVIHSFVDSILDSSITPLVPQQDVYDVMSVCFAAEESMNTGKSISIEYLN